MTKFYAQEKRVFDLNKVTVVGSPSISEDGVASGFSKGSNYITASLNISNYNTLVIQNKFNYKVNTNESGATYWLNGIKFRNLVSSSGVLQFYTEESSNYYVVTYPANNFKDGDVVETRVTLTNSLINTEVWVNGVVLTPKPFLEVIELVDITSVGLGSSYYQGNNPFQGSIDLTAFKIYADGELVYSPTKPICYLERRKEGFDLSKFTVVGSPTITDDGVASGFSASNYIKLPLLECSGSIEKLQVSFNCLGTTTTASRMIARMYETGLMIYSNHTGVIEVAQPPQYGSQYFLGAKPVNRYADCIVELILDKVQGKLTASYYENGVLIGTRTVSSTLESLINSKYWTDYNIEKQWYLGYQGFSGGFPGSIDLSQFLITVDGKEVFTGAKEKFYAMRGM